MLRLRRISLGTPMAVAVMVAMVLGMAGVTMSWDVGLEAPAASAESAAMLVLVIGGGNKPQYDFYRSYWRLIAQHVRPHGIHVYLLGFDPLIPRTIVDEDAATIVFRGENSIVPGALNETIMGAELIIERKMRGHDAPIILRSNLSTFWRLVQVLARVAPYGKGPPLYGGYHYVFNGDRFVAGSGIFMNRAALLLLLRRKSKLEWARVDDIAIGVLFANVREGFFFVVCVA